MSAAIVSDATTSVAHNRSTAAQAPIEKPAKFSGFDFKRMTVEDVLLSHYFESSKVH